MRPRRAVDSDMENGSASATRAVEFAINLKTAQALGVCVPANAARARRRGERVTTARVHHRARGGQ